MQSERGLGLPIAIYRGRQLGAMDIWTLLIPGALGVLAPLAYGIWRANYAYTHFGPVAAAAWSRPWFLLATLALILFSILLLLRLRQIGRFVSVHQDGIRFRLSSPRVRTLRWQEISAITTETIQENFLGIQMRTYWRASLYTAHGISIRLDESLHDLPELISRLKARLYPRLLPQLRARLRSAEWIEFGPLAIHLDALRVQGRSIPWAQVEHLNPQSGYLMVELEDQSRRRIPLSEIPNLELLLQLVQQGVHA